MIVDVYLEKALPQIDQLYSYAYDGDDDIVGKRVIVPFGRGNKTETAVVLRKGAESEKKLKFVGQVLDTRPILTTTAIALGMKMRDYFVTSYVQAFQPLLPKYVLGGVEEVAVKLTEDEETRALFQGQESLPTEKLDGKRLNAAVKNKKAAIHFRSTKPVKKRGVEKFCTTEAFNESMTDKQAAVYELVKKKRAHDQGRHYEVHRLFSKSGGFFNKKRSPRALRRKRQPAGSAARPAGGPKKGHRRHRRVRQALSSPLRQDG